MKLAVTVAAAMLAAWSFVAAAQEPIYKSTGKSGIPEFSDQPTPGSSPVELPPPNVIDTPPPPPVTPPPPKAVASYSQLAILVPAEQDTIHTNTGAFDVKVAVQPALNAGDAFVLTLDGTTLPTRYTSTDIAVTQEDYESAAVADVQHQLQVAVVKSDGSVLITANPVNFYTHRATVH